MSRALFTGLVAMLALAAGIALGGGPLSTAASPAPSPTSPAGAPTETQDAAPAASAAQAFGEGFARAAADRLYGSHGLAGRGVAVVELPGAPEAGIVEEIEAAGGVVTARVSLADRLLDPSSRSLVDALGSQVAAQVAAGGKLSDATAYDRVGALLGAAIATRSRRGAEVDRDTDTVLESLRTAQLAADADSPSTKAQLLVVVLGADLGTPADAALAGVLSGLATSARSLVVTGDTASGLDGGTLARLRAAGLPQHVSTVDGIDSTVGRVTVGLALLASLESPGGSFGASGSDGAAPVR